MDSPVNNNQSNSNQGNIMKELSDIKESLATNTEATKNIKESLADVKSDIRDIKANYITQDQHKELMVICQDHETRLRTTEAFQNNSLGRNTVLATVISVVISIIMFSLNKFIK